MTRSKGAIFDWPVAQEKLDTAGTRSLSPLEEDALAEAVLYHAAENNKVLPGDDSDEMREMLARVQRNVLKRLK